MNIWELIYNNVTAPILGIISKAPEIIGKFVLFIIFLTIGYVLGKVAYYFTKFLLKNILNLNEILEKYELKSAFYGYDLISILSGLAKWYVYVYFILLGLDASEISLIHIVLPFLTNLYIAIGIFLFGLLVAQFAYNVISKSDIKEKDIIREIARYVITYIFFVLSLDQLGLRTDIFLDILRYFAIAASISFGILVAIIVLARYRGYIEKIIKWSARYVVKNRVICIKYF